MPTLAQSLHSHDLGHLRILAEHWGVELRAPDARRALKELEKTFLDAVLVSEIVLALSDEGQAALGRLIKNRGRLPWSQFTRDFGDLRAVGPGRRDRERPDRTPISAAEELWYRGLIARAFFETSSGAQEFAYIPDDLGPLIPTIPEEETASEIPAGQPQLGRAATLEERAHPILADDRLLDHICTLLAARRLQIDPTDQINAPFGTHADQSPDIQAPLVQFSASLLDTAELLDPKGLPDLENTRAHLEAPRDTALIQLAQAWLQSQEHNDLHHVPHLQAEGEWHNDPLGTRLFLVGLLTAIPDDTWWSISAFLADLRRDFPDFQRPASDYDSWFIRDTRSDQFLRGFAHWDDVDGALTRYLITGPLHWLGILDLAVPAEDNRPEKATAFRHSKWAAGLVHATPLPDFRPEDALIHVRSDGRISIPFLTPRAGRYQIARFCQWEQPTSHEYRYRLTPGSLTRAIDQGLKIQHLQRLLAGHAQNMPPNIVKALSRWEQRGTEAHLQPVLVLRLGSPELLKTLRNSRAARYLGDMLGPTTVVVKPGAGEKVMEALTEMGYLGEVLDAA
jgi:hypothetical protein